jgi:integrase
MSDSRVKLTKTFVDSVQLRLDGGQAIYRDSDLIGFALRVTKVKTYIAEKKLPNGSPCRATIGQHGIYTVATAREKARELLLLMSQGTNPNKLKKEAATAAKEHRVIGKLVPTLKEAYDVYKIERKLKPKSIVAYDICINDYFFDWNDTKLTDINKKMVQDKHALLTERSPAQADLAMKFLRSLYNFSFEHYLNEKDEPIITCENPVITITKKKAWNDVSRRRTYIRSEQTLDWIYGVVTTFSMGEKAYNKNGYTNQDFLILLILTGVRREEAESLPWSSVDLKYGTIAFKDTKNGEPLLLPVGNLLWHILKERKNRSGGATYVFPNRYGDQHIIDRRGGRENVTKATGIDFTFHDLRRTFGSVANSLAIGSYTIKRLINHTVEDNKNDVTDGYIQVSFDDLRKAMNMIEDLLFPEEVRQFIYNRQFKKQRRDPDPDLTKNPAFAGLTQLANLNTVV